MPVMSPFEGAKAEGEDQKKQLLEVIAQSGAAGTKAYNDAKAAGEQQKQSALDWASQRARLTGQDLGGANTNPVVQEANRFNTYYEGQNAANLAQLGQIGTSAESYLAKVGAIAPFMQQKALDEAAARENQYKTGIAANQAEIDAAKLQRQEDRAFELEKMARQNQYNVDSDNRTISAAERAAAAPKPTPLDANTLLGAGKAVNDQLYGGGHGDVETARAYGAYKGIPAAEMNRILTPQTVNSYNEAAGQGTFAPKPAPPPGFDANWVMQNVTMPGTNKLSTSSRAADVMKAPEVNEAKRIVGILSSEPLENGRIARGDEAGMTPREAFDAWLNSVPGILTMKQALRQYYYPYLDSLR